MSSAMVVKVKKGWGKAMWMCLPITILAAFGVLLLGQVQAADAPATVGALRDGGGKPLTKNEILKLFAGATINGTAMGAPNSTFQLKYMPNVFAPSARY